MYIYICIYIFSFWIKGACFIEAGNLRHFPLCWLLLNLCRFFPYTADICFWLVFYFYFYFKISALLLSSVLFRYFFVSYDGVPIFLSLLFFNFPPRLCSSPVFLILCYFFICFVWKVTTGASDDLRKVTQIVYMMLQQYGMGDGIGQLAFPRSEGGGFMPEERYSKMITWLLTTWNKHTSERYVNIMV